MMMENEEYFDNEEDYSNGYDENCDDDTDENDSLHKHSYLEPKSQQQISNKDPISSTENDNNCSDPLLKSSAQVVEIDRSKVRSIVADLVENDGDESQVESDYVKPVLAALCVTKNEALHGKLFDRARKIQTKIDNMKISEVEILQEEKKPLSQGASIRSRSVYAQTVGAISNNRNSNSNNRSSNNNNKRIPNINTYKRPDNETEHLKYQSELEVTEHFWTTEIKRFKEMRSAAYKQLLNDQKNELQELSNTDLGVKFRETVPSRLLREKTQRISNEQDASNILSRADRVDMLEFKHAEKKAKEALNIKIEQMKMDQTEERAEFDRRWDTRWETLQTQMMQEIGAKQKPLLKQSNRNLVSSQNERAKMRRSCPASILSDIIRNK